MKNVNVSFLKIILCYYFSSEAALQGVAKNNSTEEQIDAESQAKLKHAPAWRENSQNGKCKVYCCNLQRLLASECQKQPPAGVL